MRINLKSIDHARDFHSIRGVVRTSETAAAVSEVLATANENKSQITCYSANSDWLFITYCV